LSFDKLTNSLGVQSSDVTGDGVLTNPSGEQLSRAFRKNTVQSVAWIIRHLTIKYKKIYNTLIRHGDSNANTQSYKTNKQKKIRT